MKRDIHFISGLPRSGSTLLCNILAQNPEIHTTPTSGCHDVLFGIRNQWHSLIEHQASTDLSAQKNQQRVMNAVLNTYHDTDKPVVIDKGRGWLSLLEMAEYTLGRKAKVIVPVRSINQILSSFEKLHRKSSETHQDNGEYFSQQTVEGRVQTILQPNNTLGLAYNRLRDVIQRGLADRLLLVEFDDLTYSPQKTLEYIYDFLGMDNFKHDFNNVEQVTYEDDSVHGLDLHTIRKEVRPVQDDSVKILGQNIVNQYTGSEFWRG